MNGGYIELVSWDYKPTFTSLGGAPPWYVCWSSFTPWTLVHSYSIVISARKPSTSPSEEECPARNLHFLRGCPIFPWVFVPFKIIHLSFVFSWISPCLFFFPVKTPWFMGFSQIFRLFPIVFPMKTPFSHGFPTVFPMLRCTEPCPRVGPGRPVSAYGFTVVNISGTAGVAWREISRTERCQKWDFSTKVVPFQWCERWWVYNPQLTVVRFLTPYIINPNVKCRTYVHQLNAFTNWGTTL